MFIFDKKKNSVIKILFIVNGHKRWATILKNGLILITSENPAVL